MNLSPRVVAQRIVSAARCAEDQVLAVLQEHYSEPTLSFEETGPGDETSGFHELAEVIGAALARSVGVTP